MTVAGKARPSAGSRRRPAAPTSSSFTAEDETGRPVSTSVYRWATGTDWVPWNDESQFKMDVIPDRTRYTVGDTATVLFASPFTDAEAWITVEREGLIEQRRMRLTSGSTTLKFPIAGVVGPERLRLDRRGAGPERSSPARSTIRAVPRSAWGTPSSG